MQTPKKPSNDFLTKNYPLTARDVESYAYCPRFIYWLKVRKIRPIISLKMKIGEKYHQKYLPRAKPSSKTITNIFLTHPELNISTIIDLAEIKENEIFLHEVKYTKIPPKIPVNYFLQLLTQAVIIERNFTDYKVTKALITYPSKKQLVVPLPNLKEQIITPVLRTIREIIHFELLYPPTPHWQKCGDCEFYRVCKRA